MKKVYDLVIIGSGPAGLSAAIYAARAKLDTLVIEKNYISGGQVISTYEVDNYPGLPGINGFDMAAGFREHAEKMGAVFSEDTVVSIKDGNHGDDLTAAEVSAVKTIVTESGEVTAKTIIIATGARHSKLGIPGEEELSGMGVSYCATCDGAFFKNKTVVVVGGGDVAAEDAIFLARLCKKVYVVHRRDELRAAKLLQERLFACENVEMIWNHTAVEICGTQMVEGMELKNVITEETRHIDTDGVFIAVGILPNSEVFQGLVATDEKGYIKAAEEGNTDVPGIFAAGDVRTKMLRQIVTAVSDGANCVTSSQNYLITV